MVNEAQRPTGISKPSLDLGFHRIKPCNDRRIGVAAPRERSSCTNPITSLLSSTAVARKRRRERHMCERGRSEECVVRFVRGLECEYEAALSYLRFLQIEELETSCKQARFGYC